MKIFPAANMMLFLVFLFLPLALSAQYPPLPGDAPISRILENDGVRKKWLDSWLRLPPEKALAWKPMTVVTDSGTVRLETVKYGEYFYQAIINERGGAFPRYSQGTWIFKRAIRDGTWIQAKVFLRSDPGTFIRLYPSGTRSKMDIIIFGSVVRQSVSIPVPFSEPLSPPVRGAPPGEMTLLTLPVSSLISLTGDGFAWSVFEPDPDLSAGVRSLSESIRKALPDLEYRDDASYDEETGNTIILSGTPVKTESGKIGLNCSGFVKWIADSILVGMEKVPIGTDVLRQRLDETRGTSFSLTFEEAQDPYFGLDWTRNLAKVFHDRLFPSRKNGITDSDVKDSLFALRAEIKDVLNTLPLYEDYPNYVENQGYRVDGLKSILYLLAVTDPGSFYIGAFNREEVIKKDNKGRTTTLRKFYHTAAFFPFFLPSGEFKIVVFESCAETDFDALTTKKETEYIHLVRLPGEGSFRPMGGK